MHIPKAYGMPMSARKLQNRLVFILPPFFTVNAILTSPYLCNISDPSLRTTVFFDDTIVTESAPTLIQSVSCNVSLSVVCLLLVPSIAT